MPEGYAPDTMLHNVRLCYAAAAGQEEELTTTTAGRLLCRCNIRLRYVIWWRGAWPELRQQMNFKIMRGPSLRRSFSSGLDGRGPGMVY